MPKVLMVAFHYPPAAGGSGVHRTLKFSRYLPSHGWQPLMLSAHPRAYPQTSLGQLAEIPPSVVVKRAFALDNARHLSLGGRHVRLLGLPDRWVSWVLGAVPAGLAMVRRQRPSIIWSTYPLATAHLIGWALHRLTGLPWVADFRDSMTEEGYPREALMRRLYLWIERQAVRSAARLVFTTWSTREMYVKRYPSLDPARCLVIHNGYDEEDFAHLRTATTGEEGSRRRPTRLVHAGVIYPDDRDPLPFFQALARLKSAGAVDAQSLRIDLRACGSEAHYAKVIDELNLRDLIFLLPGIPFRESLQDCAEADALLLFQAASCNHQIPAKAYEYLRLRKPIFAVTDHDGDTAQLLREAKGATLADLARSESIVAALPTFLEAVRRGRHPLADSETVRRYSRPAQAAELAHCLTAAATLERT
jgi:glycosyltransferase involved in cell wall biosynthesis